MTIGTDMAKKRSKSATDEPVSTPRKSPAEEPRTVLFSVKGRPAWLLWLKRLAKEDRTSVVELIDRATARYAKDIGFTEQPPER
jgi:hypothetical protein